MSTPLLATKLYAPPPRPDAVHRARLLAQLDAGLRRKLTLISAPAGFGKTTLASEWVSSGGRAAAWLSLDEGDNDPTRFLSYLVAALQQIATDLGAGVLGALHAAQPPPLETLLTVLLNEIMTIPGEIILVLDDYHVIDTPAVDQALTFLLEHQPASMHLVITTREDPPLPLARMRARGQLSELRAADLRFTPAEAAEFLNQVMDLDLSTDEIAALDTRTEGWIAGLQLAALSMQGREDVHGFIRAFAGDNRYIVDYLVEEVLQRQPARVRTFLLQTSILDRLNGSLCDAVTGQDDGPELLDALERGNLFVIPLDDRRRWYRYHPLFADVLQARLTAEQPDRVPDLHRRASDWYAQHGSAAAAVRHAFAAKDFERAANQVELAWRTMDRNLESATWLRWARALPDDLVRERPVLSIGCAWALLSSGELEAGQAHLRDAERLLETAGRLADQAGHGPAMIVVDQEAFRALPASVAAARAFHAQALGDAAASMRYARRALDLLPADDYAGRAVPAAILGLTYWSVGELEAAYQSLAEAMTDFERTGNIVAALSGTYGLADIRIAQGQLREAIRIYQQALQLALAQGEPVPRGTADLYLGLSDLFREQGELGTAIQQLQQSEALGEQAALPDWPHRLRIVQARIKQLEGDLDAALSLLDEAERLYYRSPVPDTRPIPALKARVWLAQDRVTAALDWARAQGLSIDDDLSYQREFEHITLARVLMAQSQQEGERHAALRLLARLLEAAESGGRTGSVIEILALQALAHQAQDDMDAARGCLERSLTLAEPQGYIRIFVDEGPPMAVLLRDAAQRRILPRYVRQLQDAFGTRGTSAQVTQDLFEPLSERELDVLRLLRTEMTGPQIARELVVSLNTMRTHTKNIYGKLGVNSRRAAVRRAEELGLY